MDSSRPEGLKPLSFIALNVPGESYFAPLTVAPVPASYSKISAMEVDFTKTWWICNRVAEEVYKKYIFMLPDLKHAQHYNEMSAG
jgi:dipeptidase